MLGITWEDIIEADFIFLLLQCCNVLYSTCVKANMKIQFMFTCISNSVQVFADCKLKPFPLDLYEWWALSHCYFLYNYCDKLKNKVILKN